MRRPPMLLTCALVLVAGCSSTPAPTSEERALELCSQALRDRLGVAEDDTTSQTQMIGRRTYGWLVRGLTVESQGTGAQNYECRLDTGRADSPELTHLRLCAAGPSPWGCPDARPAG